MLGPFRERLFDEDFDGQAWASELCSLADPIVDVVGFMQDVLAEQACQSVDVTKTVDGDLEANLEESSSPMNSPNAGSWTSVEAVMEVLEKGARRYRIKREALRLDAKEDENAGVAEAAAAAAGTEAFVYEESDDATHSSCTQVLLT